MSNTCYIFSLLFLFHWLNQVVTNFTLSAETSVILLLHKFFPSNAAKKLLVKKMEHKIEKAFLDGIRFYSVLHFLHNFPDLSLFIPFVFSKDR